MLLSLLHPLHTSSSSFLPSPLSSSPSTSLHSHSPFLFLFPSFLHRCPFDSFFCFYTHTPFLFLFSPSYFSFSFSLLPPLSSLPPPPPSTPRTPGTGLYDNLQQYKIPDPTAIFDITYFVHNPRPFFALARELYPGKYAPNPAHYFVRLLQDKGVLLRNYTQNIDGMERRK